MTSTNGDTPLSTAIEITVTLALIAGLLVWCFQIVQPFLSFIIWGTVIAVAMHQPFLKLQGTVGGSRKLATLLFVVLGLGLILIPTFLFAETLLFSVKDFRASLDAGTISLPKPAEGVREWPMIGERVYAGWASAAGDLEGWFAQHSDQVKAVSSTVLSKLAGLGGSILQFVLATLIAAGMLANAESAAAAIRRFCHRIVGGEADNLLALSTATVRSVAVGVLGIAFIQALLAGIGMVAVGVPAAGLLALLVLVVAIAQLPPWLILLPVIAYVFSVESTTVAVVFAVWSMAVSFADMALKPMFLGRGVDAPMPVILLGAIGGLLMSGIIGLFVGAVVLALGYKLFQAWLNAGEQSPVADVASDS